jgi:hypothetical protein
MFLSLVVVVVSLVVVVVVDDGNVHVHLLLKKVKRLVIGRGHQRHGISL